MSRTISINIPHRLTEAEVRSRIAKGIVDAQSQAAAKVAKVQHTWTDNHLDFNVGVLGQSVTGHLDIRPHDVAIHINLPWMLAAFADRIRPQIQAHGSKLLGNDPPK
jgi:hypothetical protein